MASPEEFQGSSTRGVHILNGIAQFILEFIAQVTVIKPNMVLILHQEGI